MKEGEYRALKQLSSISSLNFQDVMSFKYTDVKGKRDRKVADAEAGINGATSIDRVAEAMLDVSKSPTPLHSLLAGQETSTYIYSTPLQRDNPKASKQYHKMDRYDGNITTNGAVYTQLVESSKDTILKREIAR